MGSTNTKNTKQPINPVKRNSIKIIPAYKASEVYKSEADKMYAAKAKIMKRIFKECLEKIESNIKKGYCKVKLDKLYSADDVIIKTKNLKSSIKKTVPVVLRNQGYECKLRSGRNHSFYIKIMWKYAELAFENEEDQKECPICFEDVSQRHRLICGHRVHMKCIGKIGDVNLKCPVCRAKIN